MIFEIDTVVNEWLSHSMPLPAPGGEGKLESWPNVTRLSLGCLILVRSLIQPFAKSYSLYRSKTNHAVLYCFHGASHLSQVPWREVEGHYSPHVTSNVAHENGSCHTWKSDMLHMTMSHVTHENESCHTWQWVMSHICMSHVTREYESCYIWKWVSHVWISHVTHSNEICHTYERVTPHVWMRQFASKMVQGLEQYHTYKWVMSHIWLKHIQHMIQSCHT